jgi:hypothetical protein
MRQLCGPDRADARWVGTRFTSQAEWFAALTGRVGYAANDWLFYAKAGGAWMNVRYTEDLLGLAGPAGGITLATQVITDNRTGFTGREIWQHFCLARRQTAQLVHQPPRHSHLQSKRRSPYSAGPRHPKRSIRVVGFGFDVQAGMGDASGTKHNLRHDWSIRTLIKIKPDEALRNATVTKVAALIM